MQSSAYAALRERLDRGDPIVLDGSTGSELVRRGIRWRSLGLRFDAPQVQAVHADYLAAGAEVLRTNTFQLNRRIYQDVFRDAAHMRHIGAPDLDRRVPELVPRAVELAQAARDDAGRPEVPIAGVMSPLEHCYRPDLAPSFEEALPEHTEIAGLLAQAGVDFLLLESMNSERESRAALQAAQATGLPVWVSFVVDADGNLLSGEPLPEVQADAVLVNCAPPEDIGRAVARHHLDGGYAHIGKFDPPSWKFEFFPQFTGTDEWPPERYAKAAREWGAQIVGGCCGTTPDHVRALTR
ncbi:MAG TPA: homocysteine S-methyltransferase family protein [Chloroflexota bacterium]